MKKQKSLGFGSTCIHAGHTSESNKSHLTPIYASTSYLFESTDHAVDLFQEKQDGFIYTRWDNPNFREVEQKMVALETFNINSANSFAAKAILCASGMAAITSLILSNVKQGQKILTHFSLYGGTQEMLDKILPGLGIEKILIPMKDLNEVEKQFNEHKDIALVYLETPANPTLQCVDIEAITKIAHQYQCKVAVDNTFATPYLQQPFVYGVDYIIHSTTKFLNGHGTAIGGIFIGRDEEFMKTIATKYHRLLGGNANAFDAFLLNNGLKTLELRMERHCDNADTVSGFLQNHSKVEFVNHLSLTTHQDYAVGQKQMKRAGAMLSFEVKGGFEAGRNFINTIALCKHAVSLGSCDTLVSHPASTTHVGVAKELRLKSGITDGLIRMSVGLENIEDIISDLDDALNA